MKKRTKRSKESRLFISAMIWGIAFTVFLLMTIGAKFVVELSESSMSFLDIFKESFTAWSSPYAFLLVYLLGYGIAWWKRLWGSLIIVAVSVFFVVMSGFGGPANFAIPAFLVGLLYFFSWIYEQKKKGRKLIFNSWMLLQGD